MQIEQAERLKEEEFYRLNGIKRSTFYVMVEILREAEALQRTRRGRGFKLSIENQLLLLLKYYKEYPPILSLAITYDISESTANRIIKWIETILSGHEKFALPGKKYLQNTEMDYEVFVVDATESPIERPKRIKKKNGSKKKKKKQAKTILFRKKEASHDQDSHSNSKVKRKSDLH
jgi:hypothetical protein